MTSYGKVRSNLPAINARIAVERCIFDAVEIRPARFPIFGIADELDHLVRLELDKFERAGADRMLPHVARWDMAGIDRRIAGGEQSEDRRLRPLQHKGGLGRAVGDDFRDVVPP